MVAELISSFTVNAVKPAERRVVDGQLIKINSYFDANPEHILGELQVDRDSSSPASKNFLESPTATQVSSRWRAAPSVRA